MCDRYVQTIRSLYPLVDHPSDIDAICIISAECQNAQEAEQLAAFIANRYPQAQTAVNRNSIDISAKGVNKATALSAIARLFHIDPSQVAAIGDGRNDLCLLEHFYGFAIRGDQVLEAAARHTVDDIAEAIAILHDRSTRNADTDNRRTVWK